MIPMNDPLLVRRGQSARHLATDAKHRIGIQRTPRDGVLEGLALEELHHQEGCPLVATDLMDHADVWVVECCRGPGLTHETVEDVLVPSHLIGKELERHLPAESVSSAR